MNYSEIPNFLYFSQEPREREPREQILKSSEPRERWEFTGFNPVKEKLCVRVDWVDKEELEEMLDLNTKISNNISACNL